MSADIDIDTDLTDTHGNCFQVAIAFPMLDGYATWARLMRVPVILSEKSPWRIVHGVPIGQAGIPKGKRYWHAWLELTYPNGDVQVWDYSNGLRVKMSRHEYYRIGTLDEDHVWRYTPREALDLHRKHGHAGPWVPNAKDHEDPAFRDLGWADGYEDEIARSIARRDIAIQRAACRMHGEFSIHMVNNILQPDLESDPEILYRHKDVPNYGNISNVLRRLAANGELRVRKASGMNWYTWADE